MRKFLRKIFRARIEQLKSDQDKIEKHLAWLNTISEICPKIINTFEYNQTELAIAILEVRIKFYETFLGYMGRE